MPKFRLSAAVTVSAYTTIEAESLEAAIRAAGRRDVAIGGFGSGEDGAEKWIIDDADGTPENIEAIMDEGEGNHAAG